MCASVVIAGSCVHNRVLANFTSEDRKPGGCIDPVQFRIACKSTLHRTRNVNHKNRFSCELRLCGQALEHSSLKHLFPLRSVTRRSQEPERKHTRSTHRSKRRKDK